MRTMTATKTLMIAAIGALAISTAPVAWSETTIYPGVGFAPPTVVTNGVVTVGRGDQPQVQSGASDVGTTTAPNRDIYRYQWGTLDNPG